MAGVLFGSDVWDPTRILAQIVALQCLYYLGLGMLLLMTVGPYIPHVTLYHFFDWRWISFSSFRGGMVAVANVCSALLAAFFLRLVVERAKKCLDFAATLYFVHFVCVCCFSGFPTHVAWWVVMLSNLGATAVVGEWLCMQKEMQDIPIGSLRRNGSAQPPGGSSGRAVAMQELSSVVTHT